MTETMTIDKLFGPKVEQFAVLKCDKGAHNKVYIIMIVNARRAKVVMRFWGALKPHGNLGWKIEHKLSDFDALIEAKMNKKDASDSYELVSEEELMMSFQKEGVYFEFVRQICRVISNYEDDKVGMLSRSV